MYQSVKGASGERGGTRTHDHMIKSHVLYQLSYALEPTWSHVWNARTIESSPAVVNRFHAIVPRV